MLDLFGLSSGMTGSTTFTPAPVIGSTPEQSAARKLREFYIASLTKSTNVTRGEFIEFMELLAPLIKLAI